MKSRAAIASALLLAGLALASPASAGVYYRAVTKSDAQGASATVRAWVEGAKAKIEFADSGNPMTPKGTYLLTEDGGRTLYLVNPEDKSYAKWDLEGMLKAFGSIMHGLGPIMNIEVSDPHVEQLAEGSGGSVAGLSTTHYRYRTTYDMKVKVFGMGHSNHVDTLEDLWTTDAVTDPAMGIWLRSERPTGFEALDKLVRAEMSKVRGFPLKTVTVTTTVGGKKGKKETTTRTEMEVTELDRNRSIPASTFEIPPGYQESQIMPAGEEQGERDKSKNPLKGLFGHGHSGG